ncbi:hypothetical protein [Citricoccus sp.]|uniref:hypothetical protein n=1 Tax=Citricoccus sp. TaxID=1978372 RepID=UPI002C5131D7|nr:hypothetical protein [Citricoccus sp.]HRO92378.1 hypothetical protein [Citricoccus sp.]
MATPRIIRTGLPSIDAGAARTRELEVMDILQITPAAAGKVSWTAGFAVTA